MSKNGNIQPFFFLKKKKTRKGGGGEGSSGGAAALPLSSYGWVSPPLFFSKPKASCIRSLWNPNPRNISDLVTSSGNNKAELETTLTLTWQGHLGVQQAPAAPPGPSLLHSGLVFRIAPCSAQAASRQENPQTYRTRGEGIAYLCIDDILKYIA